MKVCVFGAGASGSHFAVKLARAGHDVGVIARGAHLEAIRTGGLTLRQGDRSDTINCHASQNPEDLGPQDVVVVATKATALPGVAAQLRPLVAPSTAVLFPQNGLPWWYAVGHPADRPAPPHLRLFQLADAFGAYLSPAQTVGGLIYSANMAVEPGVVANTSPGRNRIEVGAIVPEGASFAESVRIMFQSAGLDAPVVDDIRRIVWTKLLTNSSGSALAVATENPSSISRRDPALGRIYLQIVEEVLAIAAAAGYRLDVKPAALQAALLDHKPSMLQDYELHRPMEVAEILLAPVAFARHHGVAVPHLETLAAIISRRAQDRGLFHPDHDGA